MKIGDIIIRKTKTDKLEIRRQLFHLCLGFVILFLLYFNIIGINFLLLMLFVGLSLSLASMKYDIPIIHVFLKKFDRPKDIRNFPGKGSLCFLIGCILALSLFEKKIALAAIAILGVGDSVAHLAGRFLLKVKRTFEHSLNSLNCRIYGIEGNVIKGIDSTDMPECRKPNGLTNKKSIEGCIIGFASAALVALAFVNLLTAFVGSFVALLVEARGLRIFSRVINDNLFIPIAAGSAMFLLKVFVG